MKKLAIFGAAIFFVWLLVWGGEVFGPLTVFDDNDAQLREFLIMCPPDQVRLGLFTPRMKCRTQITLNLTTRQVDMDSFGRQPVTWSLFWMRGPTSVFGTVDAPLRVSPVSYSNEELMRNLQELPETDLKIEPIKEDRCYFAFWKNRELHIASCSLKEAADSRTELLRIFEIGFDKNGF